MKDQGWLTALSKAAGCSHTTIRKGSLRLAALLDEKDFEKFALSAEWVMKE